MTVYAQWLGSALQELAPECQAIHGAYGPFRGEMTVTYGKVPLAGRLLRWLGFPQACEGAPLTFGKQDVLGGERWVRIVADKEMVSLLTTTGKHLDEVLGPMRTTSVARVENSCLKLVVAKATFAKVPVPRVLLGRVEMREWAEGGLYHFCVDVNMPFVGFKVLQYRGWLRPETDA